MKPKYGYAIAYYPNVRRDSPPRGVASIAVRLTPKRATFAGLYELCTHELGRGSRVQMGRSNIWDRESGTSVPYHPMVGGWRLMPETIRERP